MPEIPALVKVLVIFALIILSNRVRIDLGLSILLGTAVLGFWFDLGIAGTFLEIAQSFIAPMTLTIMFLVMLILIMNRLMEQAGQQKRMVYDFSRMVKKPKVSLAALPALIGLLPMPGGAYFSAPMVEAVSEKLDLQGGRKTVINYWFRHVWETWWPIYPGVILAVSLTGLAVSKFIAIQIWFSPVAIVFGAFILLRGLPATAKQGYSGNETPTRDFLYSALPILIILGCVVVLGALRGFWEGPIISKGQISKYLPVFTGLVLANGFVFIRNRLRPVHLFKAMMSKKILQLIVLVFAVMSYKQVLNVCGAIGLISKELHQFHIPLAVVVMFLPFISGMVMGIAVGFVGSSFPLVMSLISGLPDQIAYISLAYGFGFMGMMLSPIHFCLVLTKDYFKADYLNVYRLLTPLCVGMMVFTLIWFIVLKNF